MITEQQYLEVASMIGCDVAAVRAVQQVETGKYGAFIAPNVPPILFEGHIFWAQLKKKGIAPEMYAGSYPNVVYPKWDKSQYKGGINEYDRLNEAERIDTDSALMSASWGAFQIMGFNYAVCGCRTVKDFVEEMCTDETSQLRLFARFILSQKLDKYLISKDWAGFARRYNGPGYELNKYDTKLADAYIKFLRN